ncbi:MAG: hypothetical protein AMJ93_13615 [Anaerolineae bacterium SM23_84]|nr:MAG: hypothetical protein AMJ93_13615 [Anaerolineae bacterium SM23_84]
MASFLVTTRASGVTSVQPFQGGNLANAACFVQISGMQPGDQPARGIGQSPTRSIDNCCILGYNLRRQPACEVASGVDRAKIWVEAHMVSRDKAFERNTGNFCCVCIGGLCYV